MDLTVGIIEDKLRKFPKETSVHLSCGCCRHSSSGNENILGIADNTDKGYEYIELNFNDSSQSSVELSKDKEEYYKTEIEKLHKIIRRQTDKLNKYMVEEQKNNLDKYEELYAGIRNLQRTLSKDNEDFLKLIEKDK